MKFHEFKALWVEPRSRSPRHVPEKKFYAMVMTGGVRIGNGLILAGENHNMHRELLCKSSRPAANVWLAVLMLGMTAVSARAADTNPTSPGKAGGDAPIVLRVTSPLDYQVFQRRSRRQGSVAVRGVAEGDYDAIRVRLTGKSFTGELAGNWQPLQFNPNNHEFQGEIPTSSGGWYRVEVRATRNGKALGGSAVEHVGIGEVFVVAGQSNSSNHGSPRQRTITGMVASFGGAKWVLANDPQPGGSGDGGSFMPVFGDALYKKCGVPIGIASVGVGATSVRQWLPRGERMIHRPTIDAFVKAAGPGQWESTGQLFDGLMRRIEGLGPHGCRAVLWHQGESDAGQARSGYPASVQISGDQYRQYMEKLIRASRARVGWEIPWFVAQATYHSEQDPADEEFRGAQRALWESKIALEGPGTDTLREECRDGVHFNAKGLQAHGRLWAERVGDWLDKTLP